MGEASPYRFHTNGATYQIDPTIIIFFTKINLGGLCLWRTLHRSHRQIFHHQKGLTVFLQPTRAYLFVALYLLKQQYYREIFGNV
ncbi:hypothetical protein [Microcoleus sp. LEGE 07076]|uniref:hypothetical protein n=1 Tax=Microcoleus sp. LEGE 07076 TaxID=915322 RepID=UPI0018817522|nr:hypothetical protein [Microcoleus sp. LEGE 07076]